MGHDGRQWHRRAPSDTGQHRKRRGGIWSGPFASGAGPDPRHVVGGCFCGCGAWLCLGEKHRGAVHFQRSVLALFKKGVGGAPRTEQRRRGSCPPRLFPSSVATKGDFQPEKEATFDGAGCPIQTPRQQSIPRGGGRSQARSAARARLVSRLAESHGELVSKQAAPTAIATATAPLRCPAPAMGPDRTSAQCTALGNILTPWLPWKAITGRGAATCRKKAGSETTPPAK